MRGIQMSRLKFSSTHAGYAFLFTIIFSIIMLLPASGVTSTADYDDVYMELSTTGSDNWTQSGGNEVINLMINNTNSSLSIIEINISVPLAADANATFSVDMSTNQTSNSSWGCYNMSSDGTANVTLVKCNTSTANITSGGTINIWFNATSSTSAGEDVHQWNVTVRNETNGYTVSQNISSGIDGLAPRFSAFDDNSTYTTGTILAWVSLIDASLDNSTAAITMVNASNASQSMGSTSENCTLVSASTWNCTTSWTPSYDGNYTFNASSYDTTGNFNESTSTSWFFYDIMAPTVTLNNPVNNGWDDDGDVEFNFTPHDTSGSLENCSVWVANSTGYNWTLSSTESSPVNNQMNNITVYGFSTDNDQQVAYIWNVRCWDTVSNSSFATQNFTVNVGDRSNIIVESVIFNKTISPYVGMNISVNVTVKNNGTADVVTNNTYIRVYFDDDSSPASGPIAMNTSVTVLNTSLAQGQAASFMYSFGVNSSQGDYYVMAEADYTGIETEQHESDNTLTESFSTNLNITVNSVSMGTDTSPIPNPSDNVTVNVTVLYDNGTGVTGLSIYNFSVYDTWQLRDGERTETDPMADNKTGGLNALGNGVYTFNYTVPGFQIYLGNIDSNEWYHTGYVEYGNHTVTVNVTENYTGNLHSGLSSNSGNYNITAPFLEVSHEALSYVNVGDTREKDFYFENVGTANITSTVSYSADDDPSAYLDISLSGYFGSLAVGATQTITSVDIEGDAAGDANITVNASYTFNSTLFWYAKITEVEVKNESSDDGDGDTTSGGDTTTGGVQYECTSDSGCDSDEICSDDFECEELECQSGYYATGHKCKLKAVYDIRISEYEEEVSIIQGGSKTVNVTVGNAGNQDLTVTMNVDVSVEGVNFNVTPATVSVQEGKVSDFAITFVLSKDAKIGKHDASFKATTSSVAEDSKSFKLVVNPLPEAIEEIKLSYQNFTALVNQVVAEFSVIRGHLMGDNLTAMETKINSTETLFNALKKAMDDEDYAQAYMHLEELNALLDSTRTLMEELGVSDTSAVFWNAAIIWLIVGAVCVGAAGLLIYMMFPSKKYALGKGYSPKAGGASVTKKVSGMVRSLKGKVPGSRPTSAGQIVQRYRPAYSSGNYNKLASPYRQQPDGFKGKMKSVLRKEK